MAKPWDVLLCDIDGTLTMKTVDGFLQALPGAVEAIVEVKRHLPVIFVSNTTSILRANLVRDLCLLGFPCDTKEVYTPSVVASAFLQAAGMTSGMGFFAPQARADFSWFRDDEERGKVVLVADESLNVNFHQVERAFRMLMRGARLFALQKNRYFRGADGLKIDLGPLVAALEYASDQKATVFGKPSPVLFESIAALFGTTLSRMAIIGDDAEFDIMYPMRLGMTGILVRTGKFLPETYSRLPVQATHLLDSVADLPSLFRE